MQLELSFGVGMNVPAVQKPSLLPSLSVTGSCSALLFFSSHFPAGQLKVEAK